MQFKSIVVGAALALLTNSLHAQPASSEKFARMCEDFIPRRSMFNYNGYMMIMLGLRVPTDYRNDFSPQEWDDWRLYRNQVLAEVQSAVSVRKALEMGAATQGDDSDAIPPGRGYGVHRDE